MLDLCWANAGMMMVSQHCASIGTLDKTQLVQDWLANVVQMFLMTLAQRSPNIGVLSGYGTPRTQFVLPLLKEGWTDGRTNR